MDECILNELLGLVGPFIQKQTTVMREPIPPKQRLAATLRFLATGNCYKDVSYSTRVEDNTLAIQIPEKLSALVTVLEAKQMKCPTSALEWEAVSERFNALWQFPNCLGAIDGKHVEFRAPRSAGSLYRNYKGGNSIVLFALADATYRFLHVDVGRNGRTHDSNVFIQSELGIKLELGELNLPDSQSHYQAPESPCLLYSLEMMHSL